MAVVKSPKNTNNKKLWRIRYRKLYTKSNLYKTSPLPYFNLKIPKLKTSPIRILDLYPLTTMIKTLYAGRIVYAIGYKKDFQKWENKKKSTKYHILKSKYTLVGANGHQILISKKLYKMYSWFIAKSNQWITGNIDHIPSLKVPVKPLKLKKNVIIFSRRGPEVPPSLIEEDSVGEDLGETNSNSVLSETTSNQNTKKDNLTELNSTDNENLSEKEPNLETTTDLISSTENIKKNEKESNGIRDEIEKSHENTNPETDENVNSEDKEEKPKPVQRRKKK